MPGKKRSYTKEDFETVLDLWDTSSKQEIADKLGITTQQVAYLASQINKCGYKLPRKHVTGIRQALIKEMLAERGLIKKKKK